MTRPFFDVHFMRHNSEVIGTTQGLIQFSTWQCKSKAPRARKALDPSTSSLAAHWQYQLTSYDNKNNQKLSWSSIKMERKRHWGSTGESQWSSSFCDFPLKVNNNRKNVTIGVTNLAKSLCLIKRNTKLLSFPYSTRSNPSLSNQWTRQSSVWFRKLICIWLPTWMKCLDRTEQNSKTTASGI